MIHIKKLKQFGRLYQNLIGIGDRLRGKTIYKYMPISTALLCLQHNTIRFSVPSTWKDPFEKYFYSAIFDKVMPTPAFDTNLFACCITKKSDCEAAWKMYTENEVKDPCVQFKIYLGQFRRYAEKFVKDRNGSLYEGCVNYELTDREILHLYQNCNPNYRYIFNDFTYEKYLNLMILKRKFYEYEGEVRYMIQGYDLDFGAGYIDVTIPWSLCLYSVKLPPNCSDDLKRKIQEALQANYDLCIKEYPNSYPQNIPQIENSLYAPLDSITIE